MTLGRDEETRLLQKYEPFLQREVRKFYLKAESQNASRFEDLLQEARLEFLIQMRLLDTEDELKKKSPLRVRAAMWEYVRQMALLSIPSRNYQETYRTIERCDEDIGDIDLSCHLYEELDYDFRIMFDESLRQMVAQERSVIILKLHGRKNKEIMPAVGLGSNAAMSRLLSKAREHLRALLWPDNANTPERREENDAGESDTPFR